MSLHGVECDMAHEAMHQADKDRIREATEVLAESFGMTRGEFTDQLMRGEGGAPFTPDGTALYEAMAEGCEPRAPAVAAVQAYADTNGRPF